MSPKRQEILEKIFAIDESLGIQSIVNLEYYINKESFSKVVWEKKYRFIPGTNWMPLVFWVQLL